MPIKDSSDDYILNYQLMKLLNRHLSASHCYQSLSLVYSLTKHGASLSTFYENVQNYDATVLIIEDSSHYVFGVYVCEPWNPTVDHSFYYGSALSGVFTLKPNFHYYPSIAALNYKILSSNYQIINQNNTSPNLIQTLNHSNTYFQLSLPESIAIGAGQLINPNSAQTTMVDPSLSQLSNPTNTIFPNSGVAIYLDKYLKNGQSYPSATFGSPTLASETEFTCFNVECWAFNE